jgi:hypothetical protein
MWKRRRELQVKKRVDDAKKAATAAVEKDEAGVEKERRIETAMQRKQISSYER